MRLSRVGLRLMARKRDSGPALLVSRESELEEIKGWYRNALANSRPPKDLKWEPVKIGPTWQWDEKTGWLLPELTIGWDVLAWAGLWLDGDDGLPWKFTLE